MASILCKYYVQNDPADPESSYPNLFVLTKKFAPDQLVKFKDIVSDFPLLSVKQADYHLRFQTFLPDSPNTPIWVDILNEEATVPLIGPGMISVKALKLPAGVKPKLKKAKYFAGTSPPTPDPVVIQKTAPVVSPVAPSPPPAASSPIENSQESAEEEFDLGIDSPKPVEEDKKRPRLDSDNKRAVFDLDLGMDVPAAGSQPYGEETKQSANPGIPLIKTASVGGVAGKSKPKPEVKKLKPLQERVIEVVNLSAYETQY